MKKVELQEMRTVEAGTFFNPVFVVGKVVKAGIKLHIAKELFEKFARLAGFAGLVGIIAGGAYAFGSKAQMMSGGVSAKELSQYRPFWMNWFS